MNSADVTAALCAHLGIREVTAVVGVSGGAPTAVAMAARHPAFVERLILQSAVGPLPWPDRRTYIGAQVVFGPSRAVPFHLVGDWASESRQDCAEGRKRGVNDRGQARKVGFPLEVRTHPNLTQELTMADVAFVVATIAVFALVALVAKGVTKL